ncbi:tetrahydroberberine oxidase-like isoform X1 [Diospyros lotus]|uniref:tetrahydroberberine oxidase-like isoform X1 n=1 Tax=Diospyros lotus TaxID=55363 RepID=UPI0022559D86|nr:tetrahydroberberine oxidase-like isoform X1 [Diospyros lotus]
MKTTTTSLLPFVLVLLFWSPLSASVGSVEDFLQCLPLQFHNSILQVTYTPKDSSFLTVLQSSIQNLRFASPSTPKPLAIVTPVEESQIQATVYCAKQHGLQIRVRSGGHDFEGLSYVSKVPFVILDLVNLRSISVDVENKTAWVQTGATVGELYYGIAEKSKTLGFPAGICPSVGVGGHFSGGGYGPLLRKYGFAADNIVDALIMDDSSNIRDRTSMGEDLFWAIRGGGGASFGIVLAWKIKLVDVPPTATVFTVYRTLEQNATKLVHKWQYVAHKFPDELFIEIELVANSSENGKRTIRASFNCLFLGRADKLIKMMQEKFPELGVTKQDCSEMNWIESALYFAAFGGYPDGPLEVLLNRTYTDRDHFKAKSDYVQKPISVKGLEGIWERFHEEDVNTGVVMFLVPYGGKMERVSEKAIPFPHRAGNIYKIVYFVGWDEEGRAASERHVNWIRRLYSYMTPFVSKSPRAAYINYRDLDIGMNSEGNTSYARASVWGLKYFKGNFKRLVQVKTKVDPSNFFRNEQSIPPITS